MNENDLDKVGDFLSRWSRRKLDQTKPASPPAAVPAISPAVSLEAAPPAHPAEDAVQEAAAPELPSVESLTPESDYTPFMQPNVAAGVKRAALKQLFKDPHFNVMDGLDIYIDDYSIEDPIPDEMMKTLYQARQHLFSDAQKAAADEADAAAAAAAQAQAISNAPAEASAAVHTQAADAANAATAASDTNADAPARKDA